MISYLILAALQVATAPSGAVPAAPTSAPAASTNAPVAATPAPAAATPATAVASAAANPDNKVICHQEDEVGTRLGGHKVCMTRAQWRDFNNQQRDAILHAQNNRGYIHN